MRTTAYTHQLHVVVYSKALADQLSAEVFAAFPEVGPNNVACELVAANADEKSTVTAWEFSAPVKPQYIEWLDNRIKQLPPKAKSLIKWWRKDRSGMLQKRWDNETPEAVAYSFADLLAECGLKLRTPPVEI